MKAFKDYILESGAVIDTVRLVVQIASFVFWLPFLPTPSLLINHSSKKQSGTLEKRLNWFRMVKSDTFCCSVDV